MWDYDTYTYYGGDRLMKDLFAEGYVDHAIFQATLLSDFYVNGFGQTEEAFGLAQKHPDKLTYNHAYDPRNGEAGLAQLRNDAGPDAPEGRQALHRRVARRLAWLQARRSVVTAIPGRVHQAGHQEHPRAQGADHPAAGPRRLRRRRRRQGCHRLPRAQLHRRACAACPGWRTSAGSPPRSPTCTAAWRWRFRSSTPGHGISPRSSVSCCTGSARTRSCSPVTMRCGRRSGSSRGSSTSRSPRT